MAVLGRVLISSAERVDLADLLSIDSYTAGDFKFLLKGLVGDTKPFILKGFDVIDPNNAIGTQSCSIKVADSMVFYPGSSTGSFYHGLEEGHAQAAPIVPELRKNATNFVYLTFSTFNSSVDTRAFWDPDKGGGAGGEFTQDVNTESVLKVDVNVSTGSFPANTIPIAKIVVGPVTIESITDCRDLMFRLGSGGISPDPFNSYQFRSLPGTGFKRTEPPITLLPGGVNPFQGADKNILSLKEWMDLVMTKLKEIGGSTYWYEDFSTYNLVNTFIDSLATTFKSKGSWTHDSSTPGLVTWTQDIQIKVTQDPRDIILRNGDKTLADEQVAYIPLIRAQVINASDSAVAFTNGQSYLNTVGGATGFFTNLSKGDWIKKIDDENHLFLRVEEFYDSVSLGGSTTTATNARSVRLNGIYQGTTLNEKARYDRGVYQVGDVVVSNRNDAALTTAGGNFHWLATRSDVIETAASLSTVTLTGTLSQPDGTTAKITSTAHGLQDGDRITITAPAAQAGTYVIEKETANIFYIPTTSLVTGAVTAFFGLVTTGARENGYGLQLENAVHEFETNDTVTIAGAVGYNGTYPISVRSSTQFQIAIGSAQATNVLATATATLARVNVRSEHGLVKIVQGGSATIGDGTSDNLKAFIGMASDGETYPAYAVPLSFDALDGMANYSALSTDSLTARASKLSAMMADKAQDKVIKYLASPSLITITNTTNGAAQEITFSSSGSTLTLITPGSDGQSIINLPSIAPGISLLTNESAYITIDRDNTTVPSIVIVSTELVPIAENIFVIASRLTDVEVYLWDSSIINVGSVQSQGFLDNVLRQNQMLKLVEGGTWSWTLGTQTVAWNASAFIQVPGLANTVNSIAAGSAVLATGEVAYVDINRFSPGGALTVVVASNATLTLKTDRIILARRENSDVIVGNHSMRLISGETKKIYAATSDQTFTYIGSPDASDTTPDYVDNVAYDFLNGQTNYNTANGESLTTRASRLTGMMADKAQDKTIKYLSSPSLTTITNTTNGAAQEITFSAGSPLTLMVPGSAGSATVTLPSVAPGISLLSNQAAYVVIDRDAATTPSIVIANISAVPIAENVFVIASRLTSVDVYLWDGAIYNLGAAPAPGFIDDIIRQNQMLKLVEGGTWSWTLGTQTVAWGASAFIQVPGLANTVNSIAAGSAVLTSGQVAYVDINRVGPGGALTVVVASNAALTLFTDRIIIARRENNDVIVGNHSIRLISGETKKLYAATSDQTFTYIGSPDASDTTPDYNGAVAHTLRHITEGTSLTTGVARLDDQLDKLFGQLRMRQQTVANKRVIVTGADTTILDATTLSQQKSNLLLNFGGAQIDFETGSIFQSDGVTPLGINFTPATIALNQYRWYSVTIIPSTVGSDNRIGGQILIIPAASDGASAVLAPRASFGSGIKLGQVVVQNSGVASVITVILQTAITQLGSGSGGDDLPTPLKLSVPGNNRVITVGPITINVPADKNYIIPSINNIVPTFTGGVVTVPATSGTITTPVLGLPFYTVLTSAGDGSGFGSFVVSTATQADGKILVGGGFTTLNNISQGRLVRLNSDGTVDTAFTTALGTGFDSTVLVIAVQTDGKILVGGSFTTLNAITRNHLVRLNSDGTLDTAFATAMGTGVESSFVRSITIQTDNKIVISGGFGSINGINKGGVARLNSDGTADTAFTTNTGTGFGTFNDVYHKIQTDGKIVFHGGWTSFNGSTRNRLLRLNSDGTFDTAFYTNLGTGFDANTNGAAIQTDGKILVGGDFTTLNAVTKNRLVRLNSDGTEDTAFYTALGTGFNLQVQTIAVQTDGAILVCGNFTTLNAITRNRLVRLNTAGTVDTAFYTNLGAGFSSNTIFALLIQTDGKILVGGFFTTLNAITRNRLVRLESSGIEDAGTPGFALPFAMGASQYLKIGLHLTSAGAVVLSRGIVGASLAAATTAPAIPNTFGIGYTVLRTDGSSNVSNILSDDVYQYLGNQVEIKAVSNRYKEIALSTDPNFYTALGTGFNDTEVLATAVQTDGKILVGGDFTTLNDITRNRLVRLNSDGTVDTTFYTNLGTGFNNGIQAIAVQTDGKILVGGQFTTFNGNTRNRLVRLNSDGTHDAAFYTNLGTGFDSDIRAIAIQIDGAIVVGGAFTTLNGNTRNYILRLNSDGTEDSAFYSNLPFGQGPNGPVRAIAIQTDGAIVVGGDFTQLFFFNRNYILRLNSDGTEDSAFYSSFSTAFDASVYTIKVQTDGKILVGGIFNILNGITRNRLVRLNTDGTEDTAFYTALGTGFNSSVYSIVLQTDGKILVGGGFTTLNAITRNVLVRLNSTGTVDTAFYTNLGTGFNLYARTITVQSNGKILFGGGFTTLNAITRNRLVRLNSDGTEDTTIAPFSALASTVLTLPKDTNSLVGTSVIASTVASSATVTITKVAHGLTTGDLVTVTTAVAIGGISAVNLSVTAVTIIALTTSTFTYTALATATTTTTGDLGRVIAKTTKSYIINDNSLEAYLNGILLYKGDEYSEIGAIGTQSNTVTALINFVAGDTLIFKIYD